MSSSPIESLCPDAPRASVAVAASLVVLAWPTPVAQVGVILAGGLAGLILAKSTAEGEYAALSAGVTRSWAVAALITFFALLVGLPVVAALIPDQSLALIDSFYRSGYRSDR